MTWKDKTQLLALADFYLHGCIIFFSYKRSCPDVNFWLCKNLNKAKANTSSLSLAKLLTGIRAGYKGEGVK